VSREMPRRMEAGWIQTNGADAILTQALKRDQPDGTTKPLPRLISLDAFRGFVMLFLVSNGFGLTVLSSYPGFESLARQMEHAPWEGVTFWDLIQPAFTFIVGAAMPFAIASRQARGASSKELYRYIAWRAFALVLLSNVLTNFGSSVPRLQFVNVLAQIGLGSLVCFLVTRLRFRYQVAAAAWILAAHWGLFLAFPGPDGAFSKTRNVGAAIDMALLGYNYSGYYTGINFIGNSITILFGYWVGMLLRKPFSHGYKLKVLGAAAVVALAEGLALQAVNPMIKRLWTASFTFYSAGWVILMFMLFYWLIEVQNRRKWAFPLVVLAMNSIFIYSFWHVLHGWLYRGLGTFTGNFWFLGQLGAIPQHLVTSFVMWLMCYWLYRQKIVFKI